MAHAPKLEAVLDQWSGLAERLEEHVEWVERGLPEALDPRENVAELRKDIAQFEVALSELRASKYAVRNTPPTAMESPMEKIFTYAKFKIHDGKLDEFKRLAQQASDVVNASEPGTLFYEWFLNPAETECVALDCYMNLDAMMEHIKNIGPTMRQIMTISDRYVEIYGNDPSQQVIGKSTTRSGDFYGATFLSKLERERA